MKIYQIADISFEFSHHSDPSNVQKANRFSKSQKKKQQQKHKFIYFHISTQCFSYS